MRDRRGRSTLREVAARKTRLLRLQLLPWEARRLGLQLLSWKASLLGLLETLLARKPGLLWLLEPLLTRETRLLRLLEPWTLGWKAGGLLLELLLLLLGIKPRLHGILITLSLSPLRHLGWSWMPAVVVVVEGRVDCLLISAHHAVYLGRPNGDSAVYLLKTSRTSVGPVGQTRIT